MGATYFDPDKGDWHYEDELASLPDQLFLDLFQQAQGTGQTESCARNQAWNLFPEILIEKGDYAAQQYLF